MSMNLQQNRHVIANEYIKPNFVVKMAKREKTEHESSLNADIKRQEFRNESPDFAYLNKSNGVMIACATGKNIQIWNLDSNKCAATLKGHAGFITCLEKIDENRLASGCEDTTVKIWDFKKFVCLKTLATGHIFGAHICLTSLIPNKIVISSEKEIQIWTIDEGERIHTLNGHSHKIVGLIGLPNGNFVSSSEDKTIKVWDMNRGECIKTVIVNSNFVFCLLLLKNGHLASGSSDNTIKIWNIDSAECVKTLQGHRAYLKRLLVVGNGELISCSYDKTIKIWDLSEGICIKTLEGHTHWVHSIRINSQDHSLVSFSEDGTIKTWDLNTGYGLSSRDFQEKSLLYNSICI